MDHATILKVFMCDIHSKGFLYSFTTDSRKQTAIEKGKESTCNTTDHPKAKLVNPWSLGITQLLESNSLVLISEGGGRDRQAGAGRIVGG